MAGKRRKSRKRVGVGAAILAVALFGTYAYQPQRIDFFPKDPPNPNPPVDPDSAMLFRKGTRVAVVAAHPDDPEFYIGGLLTLLRRSDAEIAIVMCTDGDKGYYPPGLTNVAENRRIRRQEQLEAAKQYGATVYFLAEPDGRLRDGEELERKIRERLLEFRPDYILSFDAEYPPRIQHNDHLNAGAATERVASQIPSARWLLRFSTHAANHYVDISDAWQAKRRLLRIHKSQFDDRIAFIERLVGSRARNDGKAIGVAYAEGLRCQRLASGQQNVP